MFDLFLDVPLYPGDYCADGCADGLHARIVYRGRSENWAAPGVCHASDYITSARAFGGTAAVDDGVIVVAPSTEFIETAELFSFSVGFVLRMGYGRGLGEPRLPTANG